jgi:23S rRNA pseudouridine1911/1915/1917 synthase
MEEYKISSEKAGMRIDAYLVEVLGFSRAKVQKLIENSNVLVNEHETKNNYKLKLNDVITVEEYVDDSMNVEPEKMDLDIVYEDDDIIVVNKANGVVVHPAAGINHGTLVNGLMYHSKELSQKNGTFRPGIVHRIDAYTTGLLVVAKNDKAHEILAKQLEEKTTHRKYIALVWGVIQNDTGLIDAPIGRDPKDRKKMAVVVGGKEAITHFKVLERYTSTTLIELQLETGRTHQIRAHMNYIGYPIVNDPVYGKRKLIDESGQCLHAKTLGFMHPSTGKYMEFTSELPAKFNSIVNAVKD